MMEVKQAKFKYGQINPETGLVYLGRAKNCKDGMRWCTPEKYQERRAAISAWAKRLDVRDHIKTKRNTDHERSKRNAYKRANTADAPKFKGKNLEGQVFGMLTAISVAGSRDYGQKSPYHGGKKRLWLCRCECGNTTEVVTGSLLKEGGTRSCGCRSSEVAIENSKKSRHKIMKPESAFNTITSIYRRNAVKRNLCWELSPEQALLRFKGDCYFCGLPPSNLYKPRGYSQRYSGIDRLDNTKGYTVENTVSCCSICNHAKHTLGEAEFKEWILRAANHLMRSLEELDKQEGKK